MNRKKSISPGCKEMVLLRGKRILALSIGLLLTIQAGATVDGKLFSISKKLEDFDAVCLPGSNRIFVAWSKKKGRNAEVMGFTFDAGILP